MKMLYIILIAVAVYLVLSFVMSRLFKKENLKGYKAFIPIYNFILLLNKADYSFKHIFKYIISLGIFIFLSVNNFYLNACTVIKYLSLIALIWYVVTLNIAICKKFDKKNIFFITSIIPFLSILILAFDKSKYDSSKNIESVKINFLSVFISVFTITISFTLLIPTVFNNITKGLDLAGGFEILYQLSSAEKNKKVTTQDVEDTYRTMLRRIDALGVSEPELTIEGKDKIRVKLAGVENPDQAREYITVAGEITFRDSSDKKLMDKSVLSSGTAAKVSTDEKGNPAILLNIKDKDKFYEVTDKISQTDDRLIVIWLDYDAANGDSYKNSNCGEFTDLNTAKCLSAATVSQGFSSNVIIQGNFTSEQVENLVDLINSGSNNVKFKEISSQTVGSAFGEDSLEKTELAGVIGILLIVLFMIFVYRFSGFIASSVILIYTFMTFLIYYLIDGVLTLPGIAALVLGVGMAVDANVITCERIKEELRKGKDLKEAYKKGVKNSFSSIFDSNITTFIIAIILFIFGESSVKGFATMLIINIIMTLLIVVFITRTITSLFINTKFFDKKLKLFINQNKKDIVVTNERVDSRFEKKIKYDFVSNFKKLIIIPIILFVLGITLLFVKGANLGIDFTGGTDITVSTNKNVSLKEINKSIKDLGYTIIDSSKSDNEYYVKVSNILTKKQVTKTNSYFEEKYNAKTDISVVSNLVKKDLIKNAIIALLYSLIGIILYISFRYKFSYAISSVIALIHDSLMVCMIFIIFGLKIESIYVAAILTIIGYSINNTIVIFDRLRENMHKKLNNKDFDYEIYKEQANKSIKETIFRSINTTITTMLPIICLIIIGSKEIIEFDIAIIIGLIVGTYSSIFLACSFVIIIEGKISKKKKNSKNNNKKKNTKKKKERIEELSVKGINA